MRRHPLLPLLGILIAALSLAACSGGAEQAPPSTDACGGCLRHHRCDTDQPTPACVCAEGYLGSDCDTCEGGYTVSIDPEYLDIVCTLDPIDCTSDPTVCAPNGTCVSDDAGDRCACGTGYAGLACGGCAPGYQDDDANGTCLVECASLQCAAHAECVYVDGGGVCQCLGGYVGTSCDGCAAGFADVGGDGTCVAVTCAAAELACPTHAACVDQGQLPACVCDLGWAGAGCDACAPTHVPDGHGNCVIDLAGENVLVATALDDQGHPLLGAVDTSTWTFTPAVQLAATVSSLAYAPASDTLYGIRTAPLGIVSIDRTTGALTTVKDLSSTFHGLEGLAYDTKRALLYSTAWVGASYSRLTVNPANGSSVSTATVARDEVALTYDRDADLVLGGAIIGASTTFFSLNPANSFSATTLAPIGVDREVAELGLVDCPAGGIYLGGNLLADTTEWTHEYCRRAAVALGADLTGLTIAGSYDYDGLAPGTQETVVSNGAGPTLFTHGTYGHIGGALSTLRIETTNPADVVCVATYEEHLRVVLASTARVQMVVMASYDPSLSVSVEPGFVPEAATAPPVRAHVHSGTADPSLTGPADVVRLYSFADWSGTLQLTSPSYDPTLKRTAFAGAVDWATGAVEQHGVSGVTLTGGLTVLH